MESTLSQSPQLELRNEGDSRVLYVRAVPYGQITHKVKKPERMRPHAFAGAVTNADKIRLTDQNHATGRRPVGVGVRMEDRDDGLYSSFRFYNTPEGRSALENVQEGTYGGVSVGFFTDEEADVDGIREIRAARLVHVSLVDEPAYENATIIDLRAADRYAQAARKPDLTLLDEADDDTPMTVRLQRLLGNVGVGS